MTKNKFLGMAVAVMIALLAACASTPPWDGMSQDEIAAWKADGFTASESQTWKKNGFDPKSANDWHSRGFDLEATLAWKKESFSAADAQRWRSSGFTISKAVENRGKGLAPIEKPAGEGLLLTLKTTDVKIVNKCGADTVVIVDVCDSNPCPTIANTNSQGLWTGPTTPAVNANFWVSALPSGGGSWSAYKDNNYGAATLVEVSGFDGNTPNLDISRVKGFNVGAMVSFWGPKIDGSGGPNTRHTAVCNDVNCDDAYWLCDTSSGNKKYSPVAHFATNPTDTISPLVITFCPGSQPSTSIFTTKNVCGKLENKVTSVPTGKTAYSCMAPFEVPKGRNQSSFCRAALCDQLVCPKGTNEPGNKCTPVLSPVNRC